MVDAMDKLVPWEDHYIIGQGFICPANVPVKGFVNSFSSITLPSDLSQSNPHTGVGTGQNILARNEFEWKVVENFSDMAQTIAASASFGVKGFGYSASGEASALSRTAVTKHSIVGILSAKFETYSWMLKDLPKLSNAALDLIAAQGAEGFYRVFGTDFIAGQRLGGSLVGLIEVRMSSSEDKTALSACIKGSYKGFGTTAQGAAAFSSAIGKAEGDKEVRVKVFAKGWDSEEELGDVDPSKLLSMAETFSQKHSGVPVAAVLRPFSSLPEFVDAVFRREGPSLGLPTAVKESIVRALQLEAIKLDILLATTNEFLQLPSNASDQKLAAADVGLLASVKSQIEAANVTLARMEDPRRLADIAMYYEYRLEASKGVNPDTGAPDFELEEKVLRASCIAREEAKRATFAARKEKAILELALMGKSKAENMAAIKEAANQESEAAVVALQLQVEILQRQEDAAYIEAEKLKKEAAGTTMQEAYKRGREFYNRIFVADLVGPKIMDATARLGIADRAGLYAQQVADLTTRHPIAFKTAHGTYLSLNLDLNDIRKSKMICKTIITGNAERFYIYPSGTNVWFIANQEDTNNVKDTKDDRLSMKRFFWSLQDNTLTAWQGVGLGELFWIEQLTGDQRGKVAFKSMVNHLYLQATDGGDIKTLSDKVGAWEAFEIVFV